MRAVAYWMMTHSKRLGAQMPTRSPLSTPRVIRPRAALSDLRPELAVGGAVVLVRDDERLAIAMPRDGALEIRTDGFGQQRRAGFGTVAI